MIAEQVKSRRKLFFDEKKHQYVFGITPERGEVFISVTTLIGLFKAKFDSDYWSYYKGLQRALGIEDKKEFSTLLRRRWQFDFDSKNKKDLAHIGMLNGISEKELIDAQNLILSEWKVTNTTATTKGTKFHNHKENRQYIDKGAENEGVFVKLIDELPDGLEDLHHPDYAISIPELRLYNEEFMLAGTADEIFVEPSKVFDVNDWKSNKKIDLTNKYQKMSYPLEHLEDNNFNHYCLQISVYAWMLEQFGYKPNTLKFTHVVIDEDDNVLSETPYYTHYMKKEVEDMLNYYKAKKKELLNGK